MTHLHFECDAASMNVACIPRIHRIAQEICYDILLDLI